MEKENCPKCKDLPEGEVVKGHNHGYMCQSFGNRIERLEIAILVLAKRYENGSFDGAWSDVNDILAKEIL